MVHAIRRFLRKDRDYFVYHQSEVLTQNYMVLRFSCAAYMAILAVYTMLSAFSRQSAMLSIMYFVFDFIHAGLCIAVFCQRKGKAPCGRRIRILCAVLICTVLSFFLLEAVFPFPGQHCTFYPFPIILLVTLFAFRFRSTLCLIFAYVAVFVVLVLVLKQPEARVNDLYIASGTLISSLTGYVVTASLRHETGVAMNRLRYLSSTDSLTGLCNRQTFEALCQAFITDRRNLSGYALLFMDVDDFKQINDTYGHQVGDRVLKGIGTLMLETFYEKDYLGRFGGDEFVVLMADVSDETDVRERIAHFNDRVYLLGESLNLEPLSLSIGLAMKADEPETYAELLSRADAELYIVKRSHKQRGASGERHVATAGVADSPVPRRRVLIADDNRMNRILLGDILRLQYDVLEVENGREAMTALGRYDDISAVLLDILMPVMNGYEVLRAMRADERLAKIPVIVTTGQTDSEAEIKSLALGADDMVVKPYRAAVIMHRLQNVIHLREATARVPAAGSPKALDMPDAQRTKGSEGI